MEDVQEIANKAMEKEGGCSRGAAQVGHERAEVFVCVCVCKAADGIRLH